MVICHPESTLGGRFWWRVLKRNSYFVMQEHKTGSPIWWGVPFRILIVSNSYMIAEAKTREEIEEDWNFIIEESKERLIPNLNDNTFDSEHLFVSFFIKLYEQLEERKSTHRKRRNSWTSPLMPPVPSQSSSPTESPHHDHFPTDEETTALATAIFTNRLSVDFEKKIKEMNIPIESELGKQEVSPRTSLEEPKSTRSKLDYRQIKLLLKIPEEEEILHEFPCFLLANDIFKGILVLTTNFVGFLDSSAVDNHKVRLSSYLDKLGTVRWNRRWVVLSEDGIQCFKSSDSSEIFFPKTTISLDEIKKVQVIPRMYEGRHFTFQVVSSKVHFFSADNSLQLNQWVNSINYLIEMRSRNFKTKYVDIASVETQTKREFSIQVQDQTFSFSATSEEQNISDILRKLWTTKSTETEDPFTEHEIADSIHKSFHSLFKLNDKLIETYSCTLSGLVPKPGTLYVTDRHLCFHSSLLAKTLVIIPFTEVKKINKDSVLLIIPSAITVTTVDHQDITFSNILNRDAAYRLISRIWTYVKRTSENLNLRSSNLIFENVEPESLVIKPPQPLHVTILTIGSRGDVQPFIALALGLKQVGHQVRICTHPTFKEFVESYGIEFFDIGGDPRQLMELCVKNGMFTPAFLKEAVGKFRGFLDDLLEKGFVGCQGTNAIIAAPSVMIAYHVAEKLQVPLFGAFTMPFTRTKTYPHPFANPETPLGGVYNYMTHLVIESVFWQPIRGQINHWREKQGLAPIGRNGGQLWIERRVPFLYEFSSHVVPKPPDWGDEICITGYWFLDTLSQSDWKPPKELLDFFARDNKTPIIYIGFGSIIVDDPDLLTKTIVKAVQVAGVRAILVKGWGDLGKEINLPESIFQITSIPHEWLFPRVEAVVHHGGAGTTAIGLKCGKPTVIVPFFGDQWFWAQRVNDLGVGVSLSSNSLNSEKLAHAITKVLDDPTIRERAAQLGKKISAENGVANAVAAFHRYLNSSFVPPTPFSTNTTIHCSSCNSILIMTRCYCKLCGNLFCDKCCQRKTLPKFGVEELVHVCNNCDQQVHEQDSKLPM